MEKTLLPDPDGILLVDKPAGITSHDVVYRIRRTFQLKKVGHGGTLDPAATGLLIMLIGKALNFPIPLWVVIRYTMELCV